MATTGSPLRFDPADLTLFISIAESGSITRGAERSHFALASASARVRGMETALGVPLFDRGRRGVTLTGAGRLLLQHARSINQGMEQLNLELAAYAEAQGATVRLLANTASTASLVTAAVTSFLADRPAVRIDLEQRPSRRAVVEVAERRADLGIVSDSADLGALQTRRLRDDQLVVLSAPSGPLARRRTVSIVEVVERPFVGLSHGNALAEHLEDHTLPLGSRFAYRVRLHSIDAVCRAVAAGIGITVLPRHAVKDWLDDGSLVATALDEPWAERTLLVCFVAEAELSPTARALCDHLVAGSWGA
ncbi:LysR family transcriptional regulator [Flexivirga sp. B27]